MKDYKSIYNKNGLEVFVNPDDYWADYKVSLNGHHAKLLRVKLHGWM